MALDLGSKKIGIAVSSSSFLASPWGISKGYLYPKWIDSLKLIIINEKVSLVLVGIPMKQGDVPSSIGKIFLKKIQLLKKSFPSICWKLIDERGSSQDALGVYTPKTGKNKKINLDSLSAVRLLEDYLENKRMVWDISTFVE